MSTGRRSSLRLPLAAALVILAFTVALAILGGIAGGQSPAGSACEGASSTSTSTSMSTALPALSAPGQTINGAVSWFGGPHDPETGPTTANGKSVSEPGIAVYDTATLNGYWRVRFPNGRVAVLQQTDVGPDPWTGRVLDVLYSALPYIGYTEHDFPTGAQVSATYLGASPKLASLAIPAASAELGESCTQTGDGSYASVVEAANLLASMHVPYNYGGGHITPARPTGGQEGSYAGLDCSSAVSFVLQHAGIDVPTMTSGEYMSWGEPGPGATVTLYANTGHVFMRIGNRYFGTSGFGHPATGTGPEWFTVNPTAAYLATFVARHPPGL